MRVPEHNPTPPTAPSHPRWPKMILQVLRHEHHARLGHIKDGVPQAPPCPQLAWPARPPYPMLHKHSTAQQLTHGAFCMNPPPPLFKGTSAPA